MPIGSTAGTAVGAGVSRPRRADKLVATHTDGYLPSDIISPRPVTGIDLTHVGRTFTIPGEHRRTPVLVHCPMSTTVVGGGFSALLPDVTVTSSRPLTIYGWRVSARNRSLEPRVVNAFAICMAWTPR